MTVPLNIVKENKEKEETVKSPHLAITHVSQGFSANNRHASLLMKSVDQIDEETKKLLKSVLGEEYAEIEKMSYENLKEKLEDSVKVFSPESKDTDVEDFDGQYVVFSNDQGLFYTEYTLSDGVITLGDVPLPVERIISYKTDTGELLMSDDSSGDIPEGVYSLVAKSFDSISKKENIKNLYKSKHENEVNTVEIEIQKAVQEKQVELEKALVDLEKAQAENASLKEQLALIEKAQLEAKQAQREQLVKSVVADEAQAEELIKSLESVEDSVFESVVKALKSKQEIVENSDLFTQVSAADQEQGEQESNLAKMLKKQFAKQ